MNAYILTVLSAALAAAVIELLAPKGEGGRLAAHVRMIAGLFLLVALLDPLREGILFLKSAAEGDVTTRLEDRLDEVIHVPDSEDYEEIWNQTLGSVGRDETHAWVASALDSVFGVSPEECVIEVICDGNGNSITLREVRISLGGDAIFKNPHSIEAYVTAQLHCPCYVTVQL